MEGHPHPTGTASDTLDRIRRGGTHLLLAAQRWLADTKSLLNDGDFQRAMRTAAQLHEKIAALAVAEASLGTVSDARILKCREERPVNFPADAEIIVVAYVSPSAGRIWPADTKIHSLQRMNEQEDTTRVTNYRHTRLCPPTTRRDSHPHE